MAANDALSNLDRAQSAFDTSVAGAAAQPWSQDLVMSLAVAVLLFAALALVLSTVLLWKKDAGPAHVLRIFGIITIIGLSALLLIVGYDNDQLTPIVGLFGAIAGYLLGKDTPTAGGSESLPPSGPG